METSPVRLEDYPEYRAAKERLYEAQMELARVEKRLEELHRAVTNPHAPAITERARAWLRREDAAPSNLGGLREELTKQYDMKRTLEAAVQLQRRAVDELGASLSQEIAQRLRPEHSKRVARVAAAVQELAAANQAEEEFRDQLQEGGISYSAYIRPLLFAPAGLLKEEYSSANVYLKEVKAYCPEALGLLPASSPPEKKKGVVQRVKEALTAPGQDDDWDTKAV